MQGAVTILSVIGSVVATLLAAGSFVRSARADKAKQSAEASQVGLEYLRESLRAQQETITRQQGEIGQLQGQLVECRDERREMSAQIEQLKRAMS